MSASNKNKRAVICIETKQVFPSIASAANSVKLAACTISSVLGKKKLYCRRLSLGICDRQMKNANFKIGGNLYGRK